MRLREAQEALRRPGRYRRVRGNVEVKEITLANGSGTRRFVLVRNPQQAERDRAERERLVERLAAEIEALNQRRSSKKEHTRRVCELKSHPSLGPYVRELASGELRIDRARARDEERRGERDVMGRRNRDMGDSDS